VKRELAGNQRVLERAFRLRHKTESGRLRGLVKESPNNLKKIKDCTCALRGGGGEIKRLKKKNVLKKKGVFCYAGCGSSTCYTGLLHSGGNEAPQVTRYSPSKLAGGWPEGERGRRKGPHQPVRTGLGGGEKKRGAKSYHSSKRPKKELVFLPNNQRRKKGKKNGDRGGQ